VTGDIDCVTPSSDRKLWAAVQRACKAMQEAEGLAKPPKVSTSAFGPGKANTPVAKAPVTISA
jgi:hypothetical protein